jgi:hypothetical protein
MKNKTKKFAHLKIYLKIFYFSSFLSWLPYVLMKNDFRTFNKLDKFCFSYCILYFFHQKKQSDWLKVLKIWNSFFLKRCGEQLKPQIYVIEGNLCLFWTKQKRPCFLVKKLQNAVRQKIKLIYFNRLLVSIDVRVKTLMEFLYL